MLPGILHMQKAYMVCLVFFVRNGPSNSSSLWRCNFSMLLVFFPSGQPSWWCNQPGNKNWSCLYWSSCQCPLLSCWSYLLFIKYIASRNGHQVCNLNAYCGSCRSGTLQMEVYTSQQVKMGVSEFGMVWLHDVFDLLPLHMDLQKQQVLLLLKMGGNFKYCCQAP